MSGWDLFDRVRYVIKTRQDSNVVDRTYAFDAEIDTKL